jgi:hypothetical protein
VGNEGYVIAAYSLTGLSLGAYLWFLFSRARRARLRTAAIQGRRSR